MRGLTLMRQRLRTQGLTLIEAMVALAIAALLMTFGAPAMSDYLTNVRMREGVHSVMAMALFAQSEAGNRPTPVRLQVLASEVRVSVVATGQVLRRQQLADGLQATPGMLDFDRTGLPTPLGTSLQIDVTQSGVACSAEMRCPRLSIDGGGGMSICGDTTNCP